MKRLLFCLFFSYLFLSCQFDESIGSKVSSASHILSKVVVEPSHSANPYDSTGQVFSALYDLYYDKSLTIGTLDSLRYEVEMIALETSLFDYYQPDYVSPPLSRLDSLVFHPHASLEVLLLSSSISSKLKLDFSDFFEEAVQRAENATLSYSSFHAYCVDFEESILEDHTISLYEQRVILTTCSVFRYSTFAKKKRPKKNTDPEWDLMVGNFTAAFAGALHDRGSSAVYSLIVGIYSNR